MSLGYQFSNYFASMPPEMLMMIGAALLGSFVLFEAVEGDFFGLNDDDDVDTSSDDVISQDDPSSDNPDQQSGLNAVFSGSSVGTDATETLEGGADRDWIIALGGSDSVTGGGGADLLEGNTGDDTIIGGDGNDLIAGGAGEDSLVGGAGNDTISVDRLDPTASFSRGGEEILSGGAGDDRLIFSADDAVSGGSGTDTFDMVLFPDEGPSEISDFDASSEDITLYYDPNDYDTAPELGVVAGDVDNTTSVTINGSPVMVVNGTSDTVAPKVSLATIDTLELRTV